MSDKTQKARKYLQSLPKSALGFFPTPLQKLDRLSKELGIQLYMKRDDFTGMNLFGGNKIRKLEYLLGQALESGATHAITYGATQSNHAMETAAACRRLGIEPILYLTAVVNPDPSGYRANLLLDNILGAEIHIVQMLEEESESEADARAARMGVERAKELNESGQVCANIPMGGATAVGSAGFAEGFLELLEQIEKQNLPMPRRIYHATGTGGTMAGLHVGRAMAGADTEIISVAASPKEESAYIDKVYGLSRELLSLIGSNADISKQDMHLNLSYWQPGYERPNTASSEAIRMLARTEGLFVDPVYTGKALAALIGDVRNGSIRPGEPVLFWHTGGATALFAEQELLGDIY